MDKSQQRANRAVASRSGGVFRLSESIGGTPLYRYEAGYGETRIDSCSANDSNDEAHKISDTSQASLSDDNRAVWSEEPVNFSSSVDSKNEEAHTLREKAVPNETTGHTRTGSEKTRSSLRHELTASLKRRAESLRDQVHQQWVKTKSRLSLQNSNVLQYTVDLGRETDGSSSSAENINQYINSLPVCSDAGDDTKIRQGARDYFGMQPDPEQAMADFQFFTSFPDIEDDLLSNDDNDPNPAFYEDEHSISTWEQLKEHLTRDMRSHYEVLGLTPTCDEALIATHARKLMSSLHPDRLLARSVEQRTADAKEFARVSLAKTELLDTERRNLHDREIAEGTWEGVPYT